MKKNLGIVAVSVLAVALLIYGFKHQLKKPSLNSGTDTGVSQTTAQIDSGDLAQEGVFTPTDETQNENEGESLTELISDVKESVTDKISDITAAVTAVTSVRQSEPESTTKKRSGIFGRKTDNSETASSAVSTTAVSTTAVSTTAVSTTAAPASTQAASSQSTTAKAAGKYEYSEYGFNPAYVSLSELTGSNWEMVLINRHYIIPDGYVPKLDYAVKGDTNSKKLDYRVAPHYNEMYQAAAKDGIYLTTVSGYRSYELQKTNFERKIGVYVNQGYGRAAAAQEAAKIILPPGTSEHNAGLAMDIISLEQSFENSKAYAWLNEHAQDYGFILRYPKDKQNITEIIYEPWHWRYVGVENAKKIKASGLCLEEYLHKTP